MLVKTKELFLHVSLPKHLDLYLHWLASQGCPSKEHVFVFWFVTEPLKHAVFFWVMQYCLTMGVILKSKSSSWIYRRLMWEQVKYGMIQSKCYLAVMLKKTTQNQVMLIQDSLHQLMINFNVKRNQILNFFSSAIAASKSSTFPSFVFSYSVVSRKHEAEKDSHN